jgi:DNA ligase-1
MTDFKTLSSKTLYKNHGKSTGWWKVEARELEDGKAALNITFAKTMDGAAVEKNTAVKGVNIGKANETTPAQQAIAEAESRWKKQLDKGYVETEEAATAPATNASGNEMPMLAHPIDKVKPEKVDWSNAFVQPKLDGHRCLSKNGLMYSRNGKPINLPHIAEALALLGDVHLDGELYCHGISLQEIGSLIKDPREESAVIEYHIYDMVAGDQFSDRYARVAAILGQTPYQVTHSTVSSPLKLVSTVRVDSLEGAKHLHQQYLEQGYEGSIVRHGDSGYLDGKRSTGLLKIKDMEDHEYTVTGYEEGTPYEIRDEDGVVTGYLRVPVWVMDVGDGTGRTFKATAHGTKDQKNAQWEARDSYVGQRNVVRHFGFTPDGIPNLPVSKCWESDKNA